MLLRNDGSDFSVGPSLTTQAISGAPAWIDYDNDGLLDAYLVHGQGESARNVLSHNNGAGTFSVVTNGLTAEFGAWDGVAMGDFDNNGFMDVFLAASDGRLAWHSAIGQYFEGRYPDVVAGGRKIQRTDPEPGPLTTATGWVS